MRHSLAAIAAVLSLVACADAPRNTEAALPVDCAWYNGPENCWRIALDELVACRAGYGIGDFADDGTSCVYQTGHEIRFLDPRPSADSDPSKSDWNAELITPEGALCLGFRSWHQDDVPVVELETASGIVRWQAHGDDFTLRCQDGSVRKGSRADLGHCSQYSTYPDVHYRNSDEYVHVELGGLRTAEKITALQCTVLE